MNFKIVLLALAVAVIGAGALMMCDNSDAAIGDVLDSGDCGPSLTYEVKSLNADDSQAELIISGAGTMNNSSMTTWWSSYAQKIIRVSLPAGLTNIGEYAFYECTSLAQINLPAGLTSIGSNAFRGCTSLAQIDLPAGLTNLGYSNTFYECTSLAQINLPAGLTSIGMSTFSGCTSLAQIDLPAGLTSIGNSAFSGCTSLAQIDLPAGLTSIGGAAFRNCAKIERLSFNDSVTIGSNAFNAINFYNLDGAQILANQDNLRGNTYTGTGNGKLYQLAPTSGTTGNCAWEINDGLLSIRAIDGTDGAMADYAAHGPWAAADVVSIQLVGVTYIGAHAFANCVNVPGVNIPNSVTGIGAGAFDGCNITVATMPVIAYTASTGLDKLTTLNLTTAADLWTIDNAIFTPQYTSKDTIRKVTFANFNIPAYAMYGQTLTLKCDPLTYAGIYTIDDNTLATQTTLTVDGKACKIVKLTDKAGSAALVEGEITTDDVSVSWDTDPANYGTGEVETSPDVLVYPASIHGREANSYGVLFNAVCVFMIIALIASLIVPALALRRE